MSLTCLCVRFRQLTDDLVHSGALWSGERVRLGCQLELPVLL